MDKSKRQLVSLIHNISDCIRALSNNFFDEADQIEINNIILLSSGEAIKRLNGIDDASNSLSSALEQLGLEGKQAKFKMDKIRFMCEYYSQSGDQAKNFFLFDKILDAIDSVLESLAKVPGLDWSIHSIIELKEVIRGLAWFKWLNKGGHEEGKLFN